MITIWRMPVVATVEQVVKDIKLQLYGTGLLREVRDTGSDLMCTCPFHGGGKERNPSCGISKAEKTLNGKHYEAGTVHCFTCGYTADLPQFVADMLALMGSHISEDQCKELERSPFRRFRNLLYVYWHSSILRGNNLTHAVKQSHRLPPSTSLAICSIKLSINLSRRGLALSKPLSIKKAPCTYFSFSIIPF